MVASAFCIDGYNFGHVQPFRLEMTCKVYESLVFLNRRSDNAHHSSLFVQKTVVRAVASGAGYLFYLELDVSKRGNKQFLQSFIHTFK